LTDVDLLVGNKRTLRDKTRNQMSHKTTNNTTPHLDDEITKNKRKNL